MFFTDAYERTIDPKNRVQIPSQFRAAMDPERDGSALYVVPGERSGTLSLYPERYFERQAARIQTEHIAGGESLAFEQLYYSLARRLEIDKQGRILVPERHLAMAGLSGAVYLAGAKFRIDLWRKGDYEQFVATNIEQRWAELQKFIRMSPALRNGE